MWVYQRELVLSVLVSSNFILAGAYVLVIRFCNHSEYEVWPFIAVPLDLPFQTVQQY